MTAPPYLAALLLVLLNSWHSDRTQERGYHVAVPLALSACGFLGLLVVRNMAAQYVLISATVAMIISHIPIVVSIHQCVS